MRVWHYCYGQKEPHPDNPITSALAAAGLETSSLPLDTLSGPGIVLFAEVTQTLRRFLQEVSHSGLNRVFAIATSRTCLSDGETWALLQAGASDVLAWNRASAPAAAVAARFERWLAVDHLVESSLVQQSLVGTSRAWKFILRQVVEVARFTDASVLLLGESGTGKELVARLIHTLDPRPQKRDLVVVDCTTIVPELSGSEFFGHERGAFTGAVAARDGAFTLADGGTLFLDEVGDLPLGLQAQLLRVIQEGTYKRVGGNTWHRTHFRLVAATNKDLQQAVSCGTFRRDLYYRIAGVTCQLPPLCERLEDIPYLARHFVRQIWVETETPELDELVCSYLLSRSYAGNVRDLKQLISRIVYRHVGSGPITVGDIPEGERPTTESFSDWSDESFECALRRALASGVGLKEISRAVAEAAIRIAVHDAEGNLQRAARKLGVTDRALQMRRAARREPEQQQDDEALDSFSSLLSPSPVHTVLGGNAQKCNIQPCASGMQGKPRS